MSKQRKKYRPKYTPEQMLGASQNAIFPRSAEEIDPQAATSVAHSMWLALDAMKAGRATEKDFNILCTATNIGTVLCERGIGREFIPVCATALKELAQCGAGYEKTGKFALSESGLRAVAEMVEVREAQLTAEGYTAGLDYQAAQIACDRLRSGHVQKVPD